ncbi:MAG: anti-sigma regulatory factor [Candidatus Aminicenantes bacterium]|nr:anti-sigma regulatory factor [Candidatus Aminicenantes bacterium]
MKSSENELSKRYAIASPDFSRAGNVSTQIKELLQEIGITSTIIRRVAIAIYEAEMNVVMYANKAEVFLTISPEKIHIRIHDEGQGITDIEQAMREGFSTATHEMREMGFGAGMGLPNIKRNADEFNLSSVPGKGTIVDIVFNLSNTGNP